MRLREAPRDGSPQRSAHQIAGRFRAARRTVVRLLRDDVTSIPNSSIPGGAGDRFEEGLVDVVGLFLRPPDRAAVFSVDGHEVLSDGYSSDPASRDGREQTVTSVTPSLLTEVLAGLDAAADGIGDLKAHTDTEGLLSFLAPIDRRVRPELELHVILDEHTSHRAPQVRAWIARDKRARWHLHVTPSRRSFSVVVERWLQELADRAAREGSFSSADALVAALDSWTERPGAKTDSFVWHESADEIVARHASERDAHARAQSAHNYDASIQLIDQAVGVIHESLGGGETLLNAARWAAEATAKHQMEARRAAEASGAEEDDALGAARAAWDAWLEWIDGRPAFRSLFQPRLPLSDAALEYAGFFARFAALESDRALGVLQRHGNTMHETLAFRIVMEFVRERPLAAGVGRALVVLEKVSSQPALALGDLLVRSRWPEDRELSLGLLEYLSEVRAEIRPALQPRGDLGSSSFEIAMDSLVGDDDALTTAWEHVFRPHLDELSVALVTIFESEIAAAHRTLQLVRQARVEWDGLSYQRQAIEPHVQNGFPRSVDFLVDCLRECLEHLLGEQPAVAGALLERWEHSPVPLLRRLAVHGWTERADVSSDAKLHHLCASPALYDPASKHETYRLIESALPGSANVRPGLLAAVLAGPVVRRTAAEEAPQQTLDLLAWINTLAPDWEAAANARTWFAARHPGRRPFPHPGFDRWTDADQAAADPLGRSELLSCVGASEIEALMAQRRVLHGELGALWQFRSAANLAAAAGHDPGWARMILAGLVEDGQWSSSQWSPSQGSLSHGSSHGSSQGLSLWAPLLSGLGGSVASADENELRSAAALLGDLARAVPLTGDAALILEPLVGVLLSCVRAPASDEGTLTACEAVVAALASRLSSEAPAGDDLAGEDPAGEDPLHILDDAYRQRSGALARVLLETTSRRRAAPAPGRSALPPSTRAALEALLAGGPSRRSGEAVLSSAYALFASVDGAWTLEHLRPLFSWDDRARATRAWSSMLTGGPFGPEVPRQLRVECDEAFSRLPHELGTLFGNRLAELVVADDLDVGLDPLGMLRGFIAAAAPETRVEFAKAVSWRLRRSSAARRERSWSNLLAPYWQMRASGIPHPFVPGEAAAMLPWVITAGSGFPEAVDLMIATNANFGDLHLFFSEIEERRIPRSHPAELATLVRFVLSRSERPFLAEDALGALIGVLLRQRGTRTRERLLGICEEAGRLGCPQASSWAAKVQRRLSD